MSDRTTMLFKKEELNSLAYYLQLFENTDPLEKMKRYYSVREDKGEIYISIGFFENELREIVWKLLSILPEKEKDDLFNELLQKYREREEEYQRELQQLKDNIRTELIANPGIKGTELATKLHVSKDRIYSLWNDIKEELKNNQV